MSWTDERVARLTKLWAEGLSASQIAADLGGVTRNAVIGKIHRLGMSGRAKTATKSTTAAQPRRAASPRSSSGGGGGGGRKSTATTSTNAYSTKTQTTHHTVGNAALKIEEEFEEAPEVEAKPVEDNVVPISRKLDLMQLTENTCKWPTGDPTMPGFSFCGQNSADEKPYCDFHNKIAFQPPSERRRRR
ncbi:GcrA family cell cycle regulator [Ahrensia sp. R2A130]|uniref:GcrA family cell cycle regulator n=1 Tax=Ahrensia sp. R2A130 TaxID=744979 RepID=UPI0001E0E07F|nr:GcrA family cell cycle regulator [Ahrensia sp. R2A130]EFL89821.1 GcrA cell cycle regulator [Ahrensia sp. R2A130]